MTLFWILQEKKQSILSIDINEDLNPYINNDDAYVKVKVLASPFKGEQSSKSTENTPAAIKLYSAVVNDNQNLHGKINCVEDGAIQTTMINFCDTRPWNHHPNIIQSIDESSENMNGSGEGVH